MSKKSKRSRNLSKDENYKPRRLFVFLSFVFVFISSISALGAIWWFIAVDILQRDVPEVIANFDRSVGLIFILLFIGYLVGLIGILKPYPPLHYSSIFASILNLVISLILIFNNNSTGLLLGVLSFIHIYVGLRFPLDFSEYSATFKS